MPAVQIYARVRHEWIVNHWAKECIYDEAHILCLPADAYSIVPHRARGYQTKNGKVENAGLMDSSYKIPGGGLVSTAEDYVLFGSALMNGKIVKKGTLDTMWTATGVQLSATANLPTTDCHRFVRAR